MVTVARRREMIDAGNMLAICFAWRRPGLVRSAILSRCFRIKNEYGVAIHLTRWYGPKEIYVCARDAVFNLSTDYARRIVHGTRMSELQRAKRETMHM